MSLVDGVTENVGQRNLVVSEDKKLQAMISSCRYPINLEFLDICYRLKFHPDSGKKHCFERIFHSSSPATEERIILNGITGMASSAEVLAILGPSGSGKSTLLNILAGRLQSKYTGSVLANGRKLCKSILRRTGFVTQDDILYPHLTVKETLVFCSLLRLPNSLSKLEKVRVTESVITELGLSKCENTIIGNAFIRGVSGGERKRVSIGHEMLVNPSLLILDEPTSGLDSTSAHRLVATMVAVARKGKTVIMSVHQPSSRVFQMFDSVILLSEGRCLYYGKGGDAMDYFSSIGFSPSYPMNPADFMLDLANGVAQIENQGDGERTESTKQSLVWSYNNLLAPKVKTLIETTRNPKVSIESHKSGRQRENDGSINWVSQVNILLQRSLKERKHETFNSLRVLQVMAAAILSGIMWWHSNIHDVQDRLGLLFFISIFWGVFPSFNSVFTFPQERTIFTKEKASGMYTLSSFYVSRMIGDLPMELILPAIFTGITYWMSGLKQNPVSFSLTLVVILGYVLTSQSLGLALGAAIMDAKQATTVVTITMLVFLLTGGFYVHKIPNCMIWIKYTSFTYYCYRLLITIQYGEEDANSLVTCSKFHCMLTDKAMEGRIGTWVSIAMMILMFVGYRMAAYLALRRIKA